MKPATAIAMGTPIRRAFATAAVIVCLAVAKLTLFLVTSLSRGLVDRNGAPHCGMRLAVVAEGPLLREGIAKGLARSQ